MLILFLKKETLLNNFCSCLISWFFLNLPKCVILHQSLIRVAMAGTLVPSPGRLVGEGCAVS